MSESRSPVDVETRLGQLAAHLTWPVTPAITDTVAARLEAGPARAGMRGGSVTGVPGRAGMRGRPGVRGRPALVAVVVFATVVAVLAATLAISPGARKAAADLLGLDSVHITTGARPAVPRLPAGTAPLGFGQAVTLDQASKRVGFPVRLPTMVPFDHPDAVYVSTPPPEGEVSLVYLPRPDLQLPGAAQTGVGLLLTEFRAQLEAGFFGKLAGPDTTIEALTLRGQSAYWLAGAPHALFYRDSAGDVFPDTLRLATNTLVWQAGAVTLRIEGDISKARALAIAESIP